MLVVMWLLPETFRKHIVIMDVGCWHWTGRKDRGGYGQHRYWKDGKQRLHAAHRFAYEYLVGDIPEGLQIDHLCFNTLCVNPEHLEPVTAAENIRRAWANPWSTRGDGIPVRDRKMDGSDTCIHGHPWIPENLVMRKNGNHYCRPCHREQERAAYAEKKGTGKTPVP